jgi:hypothetical protein
MKHTYMQCTVKVFSVFVPVRFPGISLAPQYSGIIPLAPSALHALRTNGLKLRLPATRKLVTLSLSLYHYVRLVEP